MNEIKKEIIETFEDVVFIEGQDDKLVGYAERFGDYCIPLYEGINYIPYSRKENAILDITNLNGSARTADGYDNCIIGHLILDSGETVLLYNKEGIVDQLKQENMEDKTGLYSDEEDCETSAIENYEYNILGSYMDGVPAFAILYSE